ncbi:MAG: hypothetical protein ABIQ89_03795 [Candidatus Saccharimonadales bacterium]
MHIARLPLDVIVPPAEQPAEIVYDAASEFLAKSETSRPYAALIVRSAVCLEELDQMQAQDLRTTSPVRKPGFLEPINQAMAEYWQQQPYAGRIALDGLTFKGLDRKKQLNARIDQSIAPKTKTPRAGLLTARLVINGQPDSGYKPTGKNIFNPADQSAFIGDPVQPHPHQLKYPEPPLQAGDLEVRTTNTIYRDGALSGNRLLAVYTSRFQLLNPVE